MKVLLAQTKGGVGKTTIAVNLSVERARAGRDVLLVDADEQRTAMDFTALRAEQLGTAGYTAIPLLYDHARRHDTLREQVPRMAPKYQDIIVDAGGRDTKSLRSAMTLVDVAIIPFQPRSFDIWTLGTVSDLIEQARESNPRLRAVAILNFCDPQAQGGDNEAAAEALKEAPGIDFLDCPIGRRKAFPNASAEGRAVCELKRQDPKAAAEMAALVAAIFEKE
jgi:chromosome partitioning protein